MNILPDPKRQSDIKFIFLKRLPYLLRIKAIVTLLAFGIIFQLFINFWFGLILISAGIALSLIRGYEARPRLFREREEWAQVTPDEYKKIKEKQKQLKEWDLDCFDITNPLGLGVFLLLAVSCAYAWVHLVSNGYEKFATYLAIDAFVLFVPQWVSGTRSYLKKDKLINKINALEKVMAKLVSSGGIQVLPMLSTKKAKDGGRVPDDARLMIRYLNAPEYFLGMQVQVSLNDVSGTYFPYLYCVLIAKRGVDLFNTNEIPDKDAFKNITFEKTQSEDADVLVIRQKTTQTSGYHTDPASAWRIVQISIDVMRKLLS